MSSSSYQRITPPTPGRFFLTFGYVWFAIGLFTGTLVLVVAVRGILDVIQKLGWGQSAQDRILIGLILLFVATSFLLARWVVRVVYRHSARTRMYVLLALAIPAVASGYAWSNPTRFLAAFAGTTSGRVQMGVGGPTFIFGSYPDEARIRELKAQGVKAIVSLQDPRVLVELQGINEERKSAQAAGISFIQAPMLPWVSDNTESLAKIKDLALHGSGTYYVHCGLGRDRVNIAKRVIESLDPLHRQKVAAAADLKRAEGFEHRTTPFQRGRLIQLADEVWMIPMPNPAEMYAHIIQGTPGHVFLLLDPADTVQAPWITKAQKDMEQYSVTFTTIPTSAGDTLRSAVKPADVTTAALDSLVARLRAQQPPYTVVVPYTTFDKGPPKGALQRALLTAYGVTGVQGAPIIRSSTTPGASVPTADAPRTAAPINP